MDSKDILNAGLQKYYFVVHKVFRLVSSVLTAAMESSFPIYFNSSVEKPALFPMTELFQFI